jgi:hypothetical protein
VQTQRVVERAQQRRGEHADSRADPLDCDRAEPLGLGTFAERAR